HGSPSRAKLLHTFRTIVADETNRARLRGRGGSLSSKRAGTCQPVTLGQVVFIQFAAAVDSLWLVPGFGQPIGAVMFRIGMVMIRSGSQAANSYCGRFLLNPVTASL